MTEKLCPLMKCNCQTDKCAWWDGTRCAIVSIRKVVEVLLPGITQIDGRAK